MSKKFSSFVFGDCAPEERAKKWEDFISDSLQDTTEMCKIITSLMPPTTEVTITSDDVDNKFLIKATLPLARSCIPSVDCVNQGFEVFKPFARLADGKDAFDMLTAGLAKNLIESAKFFEPAETEKGDGGDSI